MEKITRALLGVEDNALKIASLEKKLAKRAVPVCIYGDISGSITTFGEVKADNCLALVTFGGGSCTLYFNGESVASGSSPFIAMLDGTGELKLSAARSDVRAILLGGAPTKQYNGE